MTQSLCLALALVTIAASASAQDSRPKRFLGGPLVIEDQGSFFIGGVQKVTTFATVPAAAPGTNAPAPAPTPQQITIGQMYVQFQIPAKKYGVGWPVIMV